MREVGLFENELFSSEDIKEIRDKRVILTKEGTFYKDIFAIVEIDKSKIVLPKQSDNGEYLSFEEAKRLQGLIDYVCYEEDGEIKCVDLDDMMPHTFGYKLNIKRLKSKNYFDASDEEVFLELLKRDLIDGYEEIKDRIRGEGDLISYIEDLLLRVDTKRVNLTPYDKNIIYDVNKGSWELFRRREFPKKITLPIDLAEKDPKEDIKDGIVGIDFGTKSTVVVVHHDNKTYPLRVGISDLSKNISKSDYENPTIMEFVDLEKFMRDYEAFEYRPYTKWEDLKVSHSAFSDLLNSPSKYLNAFVKDLKQWVSSNKKIKLKDKQGKIFNIGEYKDCEIDLIEIYAYMLGNYINNQFNGVFLEYSLSFPVSFSAKLKSKILSSFKRGLSKSLPFEGEVEVSEGASEPAAYSIVALKHYGFGEREFSFYGVFDFGGGTTDFDFGVFRFADENNKKERRYDYVLEHFGSGSDEYLGGENLLELLAYEIFKDNIEIFRENKISFYRPFEGERFAGDEVIVNDSAEAKINLYKVVEAIREFWERDSYDEKIFDGEISVNLVDSSFIEFAGVTLKVDEDKLLNILKSRIKKGVDNFFEALREAVVFYKELNPDFSIDTINIFLAGNSSKSILVKEAFEEKITNLKKEIENGEILIFDPIDNSDDYLAPNGKTGVAFGLIESRKGGKVLVKNLNLKNRQERFKYYIGYEKRGKFKVVLSPESEFEKWVEFIDASEDVFEVFYTSYPLASTNNLDINDPHIKKLRLKIDKTDEDGFICIRIVGNDEIEYGVDSFNFSDKKRVKLGE